VASLKQAAEMITALYNDNALAGTLEALAVEVEGAIQKYGVLNHPKHGKIYAFEVDGFGSSYIMDDSNVPSLLSLPYLGVLKSDDPIYQNTRKFALSADNPYFFKGTAAEGIGGPHVGQDMIWPMSITMRALTSTDDAEIKWCIQTLQKTHAGTGFMHESFHKDDPAKFTRSWFAWSNTLFGELLWKTYEQKPALLNS
jgi:meiotically up-regulated gene 157 (Mug157) protein